MDVQMTALTRESSWQWEAEKQRRMDKARAAIERYECTPNERRRKASLRAIERCSLSASSENRLSQVLSLIEFAPRGIFWPAFMDAWSVCDATWHARTRLLQVLQAMEPAVPFFSPEQRAFFDALPAQINVFRGCSGPRVRAVSWTIDRTVAEGFARGHRSLRVPDPVVASAVIPKEYVLFVTDDRAEKELVLNPRRLRRLMFEPYTSTLSHAA